MSVDLYWIFSAAMISEFFLGYVAASRGSNRRVIGVESALSYARYLEKHFAQNKHALEFASDIRKGHWIEEMRNLP